MSYGYNLNDLIYGTHEPPWFSKYYTTNGKKLYRDMASVLKNAYHGPIKKIEYDLGRKKYLSNDIISIFSDVVSDNPMLFKWKINFFPDPYCVEKVIFKPICDDKKTLDSMELKISSAINKS